MRRILLATVAAVVAVGLIAGSAGAAKHHKSKARGAAAANITDLRLTPSNAQLAACMPHARVFSYSSFLQARSSRARAFRRGATRSTGSSSRVTTCSTMVS